MTPDLAMRFNLHRAGRSWRGRSPACGYAEAFTLDVRDGRTLGWRASCQDQRAIGRLASVKPRGFSLYRRPIGNSL